MTCPPKRSPYWKRALMSRFAKKFSRYSVMPLLALVIGFAAFVFAPPPEQARAVWTVNSGRVDARLNTVTFVDPVTGFAAGGSGTILKTADGGASWRLVHKAAGHEITGIAFRDATTGWAVTLAGAVFSTTDSGESWSLVSNDLAGVFYVAETIYDLAAAGTSRIMAVGGAQGTQPAVWESQNGIGFWGLPALAGSYDPPQDAPPYPRDGLGVFYGIDAVTPGRAWAVGIDILRSPHKAVVWRFDGGNWTEQSLPGETLPFFDVSFSDESSGVAVGAGGRIRHTVNGGATWTSSSSGITSDLKAVSIARGATSGFAVGSGGVILRTTDTGLSWTRLASPVPVNFEDVYSIDTSTAVAVGDNGYLVRTSDGGVTWSSPAAPPPPSVFRVAGPNRFLTAIEAARLAFGSSAMTPGPDGRRTVIIASGRNWPDALAASGLAGMRGAPLLLTEPTVLPPEVAAYISQLQADRVIIAGGPSAVSDGVMSALARLVGGQANVTRFFGADRYETAHQIASATVSVPRETPWDGTAFIATGLNFPDALAAAPLAAARGIPVYLVPRGGISATTISMMRSAGVSRVYLLGGTGVVCEVTEQRIRAAGIQVAGRWGGADRFATGRIVAERSLERGLSVSRVALATGRDFPDALSGGVLQGHTGSVLLLTESFGLHNDARVVLQGNVGRIRQIRPIGGESVLSSAALDQAVIAASP